MWGPIKGYLKTKTPDFSLKKNPGRIILFP